MKRKMGWMLTLMFVLLIGASFTACTTPENMPADIQEGVQESVSTFQEVSRGDLAGTWVLKDEQWDDQYFEFDNEYQLKSYVLSESGETKSAIEHGTYTLYRNVLIIVDNDGSGEIFDIDLNGDTLCLTEIFRSELRDTCTLQRVES